VILAYRIDTTKEQLENIAGLSFSGGIARRCGLTALKGMSSSERNALVSMYGLFTLGRSSYEEIELYRRDRLFRSALDLSFVPAAETLRLYLERCANKSIEGSISACNQELLKNAPITPIKTAVSEYVPVDIDVTTFDNSKSHKEGVSRTYAGYDGYSPIMCYLGAEGYLLDCELRPGSQHCQKGTPEFLTRALVSAKELNLKQPLLLRLDSGNDAFDTIKALANGKDFFLIKRNLRKESKELWLERAQSLGNSKVLRPGKVEYTGTLTLRHPKADENMEAYDIVFQVTETTIDHEGNALLFPEIDVETWWTNLYESAESCIALYHDHATSEQFHSELKTDMDVERLPSGKMAVNSLILKLAMLAYNALRRIGQSALAQVKLLPYKTSVFRKRIRKVISDIMYTACKFVRHERRFILRLCADNPWLPVFRELSACFQ
jgi:hypothetical protein